MYQFKEFSAGGGGGAAALTLEQALFQPTRQPRASDKLRQLRPQLHQIDFVTDLGVRIGSEEWFRGFATCAALCYAAYALAPQFEPVTGASPPSLGDAQAEEARVLSIGPLAYGADTGRRAAPTDAVKPLADIPERPIIEMIVRLGNGDGFVRALERAGIARSEAGHVASLVGEIVRLDDIKPGTVMDVTLGRRPNPQLARPVDSLSFRARFDLKLSIQRIRGKLTVERHAIVIDETPLRIQGRVGPSLYRSARAAGVPAKAAESFIRAVATQIDIGSINSNDRFDMVLEHRRAETGESETGQLLYAGLHRSAGKDLQLMQWKQVRKLQWFEAAGVGKARGLLQRPVPGLVSSSFGLRRHPILGYTRMHKGVDFRAGFGTPVLAATDGRVSAAGWAGGYGRQVRIIHAGGLMSSYSHMSRIVGQPGRIVRQGQVIGYVGSTGLSTGPHLHYELHRNGIPINPASVRFMTRSQLSGPNLAKFRARLRSLLAVAVRKEQQAVGPAAEQPRG